jgi:predicted metalloendopeptidase
LSTFWFACVSAYRANGTVRNIDEWYAAFNVGETAKLYLSPD